MKLLFLNILLFAAIKLMAQTTPPKNWHLLDLQDNGYYGISLKKAYKEFLKEKHPQKKIVIAMIDDGLNTNHPVIRDYVYANTKEIGSNGKDDDNNGYVDDINGWNFCGCIPDANKWVKEYVRLRPKFENTDSVKLSKDPNYGYWKKVVSEKNAYFNRFNQSRFQQEIDSLEALQNYWRPILNISEFSAVNLQNRTPNASAPEMVKRYHTSFVMSSIDENGKIDSTAVSFYISSLKKTGLQEKTPVYFSSLELLKQNNQNFLREKSIGDKYPDKNRFKYYGLNKTFCDSITYHGNLVAVAIKSLIDAVPESKEYIKIMPVQIFPYWNGVSAFEKDIANAIRYAVDNRADVINMSFAEDSLTQKKWITDAVRYAEKKGVLLVRGAGNNGKETIYYPNPEITSTQSVDNFLIVGGNTYSVENGLVWGGSSFGKNIVDLFAPSDRMLFAKEIDNNALLQGTSFASPIVATLAAIMMSYYPELGYKEIKQCIMQSANPIDILVKKPGTSYEKVPFSGLSKTGGIVNAYKAFKLAEQKIK